MVNELGNKNYWIDFLNLTQTWFCVLGSKHEILYANKKTLALFGVVSTDFDSLKNDEMEGAQRHVDLFQFKENNTTEPQKYFDKNGHALCISWRKIEPSTNFYILIGAHHSSGEKRGNLLGEMQEEIEFKKNILESIVKTSERLLKSKDVPKALSETLTFIGEASQVDRIYYFEKNKNDDLFSQKIEWTRGSVKPEINNPNLQNIDLRIYDWGCVQLMRGNPVTVRTAELTAGPFQDLLMEQEIVSMINLPIFVKGALFGFVGFDFCDKDKEWTADETNLLMTLANNISIALERVLVQDKLEFKANILTVIGYVNEKLFNTADVLNTLAETFSQVGMAVQADRVYYFEKNRLNDLFSQKVEWTKEHVKPEINNPMLIDVDTSIYPFFYERLANGLPYAINISDLAPGFLYDLLHAQDIVSLLNIPISVMGELRGFIGFDDCSHRREWSEDELVVLTSLARSVANAIEKNENQEKLERKTNILSAIGYTNEKLFNPSILVSESIIEALSDSFPHIGIASGADRVYYFEKNRENNLFSQKVEWTAENIQPEIDNPVLQNMDTSIFPVLHSYLSQGKHYVIVADELDDEYFKKTLKDQGIISILNIPFKVFGEVYGFIGFDDCTKNRTWSNDELSVLVSLANNVATAIEKNESQRKIVESERNFRQINETINDVFWLYNMEKRNIDYISPSCKKVFGLNQEYFYKKHDAWLDYVFPEDHEQIYQAHRAIEIVGSYEVQYRIRLGDQIKWIFEKSFAIKNADGTISKNTGVSIDITEVVLKQQELERLLELTNRQNERLTNFAHIISHNIRSHSSNLSSLMAFLSESPTKEETELYMSLMQKSTDKLAETIHNLNDIITIQNYAELEKTPLNLYQEIEKTRHSLSAEIQNSQAKITNAVPENVFINFVPAYMESILLNFLSNALKYKSNEKTLEVDFRLTKVNRNWCLAISDNGMGIDLEKNRHKIFGMFKTFHKNSDSKGMGLFIAKSQLEALQGRVEVQSEIDKGTTFYIYFHDKN